MQWSSPACSLITSCPHMFSSRHLQQLAIGVPACIPIHPEVPVHPEVSVRQWYTNTVVPPPGVFSKCSQLHADGGGEWREVVGEDEERGEKEDESGSRGTSQDAGVVSHDAIGSCPCFLNHVRDFPEIAFPQVTRSSTRGPLSFNENCLAKKSSVKRCARLVAGVRPLCEARNTKTSDVRRPAIF